MFFGVLKKKFTGLGDEHIRVDRVIGNTGLFLFGLTNILCN
jgi:hypothetical protein